MYRDVGVFTTSELSVTKRTILRRLLTLMSLEPDIFVKPAKSINFITLTFIATRTGISFEELGI